MTDNPWVLTAFAVACGAALLALMLRWIKRQTRLHNEAWRAFAEARGMTFRASRGLFTTFEPARVEGTVDGVALRIDTVLERVNDKHASVLRVRARAEGPALAVWPTWPKVTRGAGTEAQILPPLGVTLRARKPPIQVAPAAVTNSPASGNGREADVEAAAVAAASEAGVLAKSASANAREASVGAAAPAATSESQAKDPFDAAFDIETLHGEAARTLLDADARAALADFARGGAASLERYEGEIALTWFGSAPDASRLDAACAIVARLASNEAKK